MGEFTKEYLPMDQNPFFNQINHPKKEEENDDFATNLEKDNKIILRNGTHRQGRQLGGLIKAATSFIPKFSVSNIVPLFTNLINGGHHEVAAKFAQNLIPHTPISNTHAHTSIHNHICDNNPNQFSTF